MKKNETKWAKETAALEREQRMVSQFKIKNSLTDKEKEKERTNDNSETGSVGSEKHFPSPFVKKGNGYINKAKHDARKGEHKTSSYFEWRNHLRHLI